MTSLINTLESSSISELLRAYNSDKNYLYFDVSVFNVGTSINIKCTDNFKEPNYRTWNGYDFIIENDNTTKFYIQSTLKTLLNDYTVVKTAQQLKRINRILKTN